MHRYTILAMIHIINKKLDNLKITFKHKVALNNNLEVTSNGKKYETKISLSTFLTMQINIRIKVTMVVICTHVISNTDGVSSISKMT